MSDRRRSGGMDTSPAAYSANTRADSIPLAILAPGSRSAGSGQSEVRSGGAGCGQVPVSFHAPVDDSTKERAALTFISVFLSLCFAIPMVLAGIMMGSR